MQLKWKLNNENNIKNTNILNKINNIDNLNIIDNNSKIKRNIGLFTIFLLMLMFFMPTVKVLAQTVTTNTSSSPIENMLPKIEEFYNWKDNKYFSTYRNNYSLDIKDMGVFKGMIPTMFNGGATIIFGLQNILAQVLVILIYYAFNLSFFDIFQPIINPLINSLKSTLFDEIALTMMMVAILATFIKSIKGQTTQMWQSLLKYFMIMIIALAFYSNPTKFLSAIDGFSTNISKVVLDSTFKATNDGKESSSAVESLSTNLWIMNIHKPWQILEFGSTEFAEENEDKVLSLVSGSEAREEIINEIAKDDIHFQKGIGADRFILSIILLIMFLLSSAIVIILAFLMIGFQFLMVIFALFGPLIFILAFLPGQGGSVMQNWVLKLLSFSMMKIVLSFVLTVILSIMISIFNLSDTYGLFGVMLIQIGMIITLYLNRKTILNNLLTFSKSMRNMNLNNINRQFSMKGNLEDNFRYMNQRAQRNKIYRRSPRSYQDDGVNLEESQSKRDEKGPVKFNSGNNKNQNSNSAKNDKKETTRKENIKYQSTQSDYKNNEYSGSAYREGNYSDSEYESSKDTPATHSEHSSEDNFTGGNNEPIRFKNKSFKNASKLQVENPRNVDNKKTSEERQIPKVIDNGQATQNVASPRKWDKSAAKDNENNRNINSKGVKLSSVNLNNNNNRNLNEANKNLNNNGDLNKANRNLNANFNEEKRIPEEAKNDNIIKFNNGAREYQKEITEESRKQKEKNNRSDMNGNVLRQRNLENSIRENPINTNNKPLNKNNNVDTTNYKVAAKNNLKSGSNSSSSNNHYNNSNKSSNLKEKKNVMFKVHKQDKIDDVIDSKVATSKTKSEISYTGTVNGNSELISNSKVKYNEIKSKETIEKENKKLNTKKKIVASDVNKNRNRNRNKNKKNQKSNEIQDKKIIRSNSNSIKERGR